MIIVMLKKLLFLILLALYSTPALADALTDLGPNELWTRALAAYNQKNFPAAIKLLEARSAIQPCGAEVFYYLGNAYLGSKNEQLAKKAFKQAVEADAASQAGKYAQQALDQLEAADQKRIAAEKTAEKSKPKKVVAVTTSGPAAKDIDLWRLNETNLLNKRIAAITERAAQYDGELSNREKMETGTNLGADRTRNTSRRDLDIERAKVDFDRRWRRFIDADKIDLTIVEPEVGIYGGRNPPKYLTMQEVFGDLSEVDPAARARAQILFQQLKSRLELLQDGFGRDVYDAKNAAIDDIYHIEYHSAVDKRKLLDNAALRKKEKLDRLFSTYTAKVDDAVAQAVATFKGQRTR